MPERLDLQRPPVRLHTRRNYRYYQRGYTLNPHRVWGDDLLVTPNNPTGVTKGKPGTFTPAGCRVPSTLAGLQALGPLGQTVAWTGGDYVLLDPSGSAYWNGTAWQLGVAP